MNTNKCETEELFVAEMLNNGNIKNQKVKERAIKEALAGLKQEILNAL